MEKSSVISVIGLGKLGSPMVACFAAKGHRVIGVDVNERLVQRINECQPPVFEPGLEEMLGRASGRLQATTDTRSAVLGSDATFLIVPTPSQADGTFSTQYVRAAAQSVGAALRDKATYHLVVLTSTVMPGATENELIPALEAASGKRCGPDFGVCYSPEFIALGSVIRDFLHPDFVLIGESDADAGAQLAEFYRTIHDQQPPVARMAPVNAELAKIALNTFVTTKISFANMLTQLCERIPGGDVDAVTTALGLDSRIGSKYLKGGLGYGGPCFPRDNSALTALALGLGVPAPLPQATDQVNDMQVERLHHLVHACLPLHGRVGILGLSYKPGTNVIERAQGLELAQALLADRIPVVLFDPCAAEAARAQLAGPVTVAASPTECARLADVLVLTAPARGDQALSAADLRKANRPLTVIDCWRQLDRKQVVSLCRYIRLGTDDVLRVSPKQAVPIAA